MSAGDRQRVTWRALSGTIWHERVTTLRRALMSALVCPKLDNSTVWIAASQATSAVSRSAPWARGYLERVTHGCLGWRRLAQGLDGGGEAHLDAGLQLRRDRVDGPILVITATVTRHPSGTRKPDGRVAIDALVTLGQDQLELALAIFVVVEAERSSKLPSCTVWGTQPRPPAAEPSQDVRPQSLTWLVKFRARSSQLGGIRVRRRVLWSGAALERAPLVVDLSCSGL